MSVSPTTAAMTAVPAAMRKPLAMCGTAAGGHAAEPGVGAAAERVDDVQGRRVRRLQARARVHEHRVEDHHGGEERTVVGW